MRGKEKRRAEDFISVFLEHWQGYDQIVGCNMNSNFHFEEVSGGNKKKSIRPR